MFPDNIRKFPACVPSRSLGRARRLGAVLVVLAGALSLGACATAPERAPGKVACLLDDIVPWMAAHYATTPSDITGHPVVLFAEQGTLQNMSGQTDAVRTVVYGLEKGDVIMLWDKSDLDSLDQQSTLAHEVAHWIDYVEHRNRPHSDVYAIQQAWERAHWDDGPIC